MIMKSKGFSFNGTARATGDAKGKDREDNRQLGTYGRDVGCCRDCLLVKPQQSCQRERTDDAGS